MSRSPRVGAPQQWNDLAKRRKAPVNAETLRNHLEFIDWFLNEEGGATVRTAWPTALKVARNVHSFTGRPEHAQLATAVERKLDEYLEATGEAMAAPAFPKTPFFQHEPILGFPLIEKLGIVEMFKTILLEARSLPLTNDTYRTHQNACDAIMKQATSRHTVLAAWPEAFDYVKHVRDELGNPSLTSWKLDAFANLVPRMVERLRVTLMSPEANQVTELCATQHNTPKRCVEVYNLCRQDGGADGGRRDANGQVDVTQADQSCLRYIKAKTYPDVVQREGPDAKRYFQTFDYAQGTNANFLETSRPTQHDWESEYRLRATPTWEGADTLVRPGKRNLRRKFADDATPGGSATARRMTGKRGGSAAGRPMTGDRG